ncbi:hypothetical protein IC232_12630 [Microvirga sp. BT688]|uniref:hypothetical protein n=1 Tax=Microvirga sp. TaxID=1873136 RepID=UPI0016850626|nr:hypothetical protein [Microvirga sp.]MBD2747541.1 hypothetical protein [Microvirga sp.]
MDSRIHSVDEVHVSTLDPVANAPLAISVMARGKVNSTGWTNPRLSHWIYIQPPKDGILDLDFIATAPAGYALYVMCPVCVCFAFPVPSWVRGVRIRSSTNEKEATFKRPKEAPDKDFEGLPLPWPFPWFAPVAKT